MFFVQKIKNLRFLFQISYSVHIQTHPESCFMLIQTRPESYLCLFIRAQESFAVLAIVVVIICFNPHCCFKILLKWQYCFIVHKLVCFIRQPIELLVRHSQFQFFKNQINIYGKGQAEKILNSAGGSTFIPVFHLKICSLYYISKTI